MKQTRPRRRSAHSLFNFLLVEYTRNFWHPLLAPLAPELPFRRQIARVVQCPCHDVSKVLHGRCTYFQNTASASWTELSVQKCTTPVICFVYCGLFGLRGIGEGGDWDFGCQSECRSEEFLGYLSTRILHATCASGYVPCSSCSGRERCGHRLGRRQWCTSARRSSSPLCRWALQTVSWWKIYDCLAESIERAYGALPRSLLVVVFYAFVC